MKVLIFGRGFAGLSLALELLNRGHEVQVAGVGTAQSWVAHPLRPASAAAVGMSSNKGHFWADTDLFELKLKGHRGLESWLKRVESAAEMKIPRFSGRVFEPFFNRREYEYLHERIFHTNPTGFYRNRIVPWQGIKPDLDGTSFGLTPLGAFEYFDDLWFDPKSCLTALERSIMRCGGQIVDGSIETLEWMGDRYGKIRSRIRLIPHGTVYLSDSDQIVLACGSHINDVLNKISPGFLLPIRICSGTTLRYRSPSALRTGWALRVKKTNFVAYGDGIIVGSSSINHNISRHDELASQQCKHEMDHYSASTHHLLESMTSRVQLIEKIWGARVRTNDRYPLIGPLIELSDKISIPIQPHVIKRLWIFTGMYKNGLQLSWLLAKNLADSIELSGGAIISNKLSLKRLIQ